MRALLLSLLLWLAACSAPSQAAPLPSDAPTRDIFIRIVKTDPPDEGKGRLEIFEEGDDGRFKLWRTFPTCTWSGELGPKLREGDGQAPEGFYWVTKSSLNPNSSYHLSFNLGFPNAYDRAHGRTGSYLMVHGDCVSIGCYAMTDAGIETIYGVVQAALERGQPGVRVHIFPFPMTDENVAQLGDHPDAAFWRNLQQGWAWFETHGRPPNVEVADKRYTFEPLP